MLDLIWDLDGADQLFEIIDYIAARDQAAAERLEREIHERIELARKFPGIGRLGRIAGTRELIVHPNYLVIYRVNEAAIEVLRVLHARQRYP